MTDRTFKVVIAGGRDFSDYELLKRMCDYYLQDKVSNGYEIIIVSGRARGADKLGEKYADEKGYKKAFYPADWNLGKGAGHIRNRQMAVFADSAILFWDGVSRGTKNMKDNMDKLNKPYRICYY